VLKFVVLSDLHLVPEGRLCHGIDPAARLDRAIAHLNARHSDAAFCVFAGDLADRDHAGAYALLRARLAALRVPHYLTFGNHDDRAAFLAAFGAAAEAPEGRMAFTIDSGGYRVLVLDSAEAGTDAGWLGEAQLDWLRARLDEARDRRIIVVLHHSVVALGVPTDPIALQDREALLGILRDHGDVRQVISGHVHMSAAGVCRGVPFTTISGSHYNLFPQLFGTIAEMPRREGPGQVGVVLADRDAVVVHHENFFDMHPLQEAPWDR
jgi:3',5'-cyclic-AMP phosphodiesterase